MFWGGMGLEEQNAASAGLSDFTLRLDAGPTWFLSLCRERRGRSRGIGMAAAAGQT